MRFSDSLPLSLSLCMSQLFFSDVVNVAYRFWEEMNRGKEVQVPQAAAWTTPEWEVFMFLGAAGTDEPHLRPQACASGKGGSSGPPQRRATKKRARSSAAGAHQQTEGGEGVEGGEVGLEVGDEDTGFHTPQVGGTGSGTGPIQAGSEFTLRRPSSNTEADLLRNLTEMKEGMNETLAILREMAATDRSRVELDRTRVELETSKAHLNSLQVQIACFPVGSAAHARALDLLEKYAAGN